MERQHAFLLLLLIMSYTLCAQQYEIKREAKKIIDNREIHLNGGANADFGGKSRTYIKIDLPPNTIQWYYSFTTSKGQAGTTSLNLAIQLTGLLADPSGLSSSILSKIKVPEGVAAADIYLLDSKNCDLFIKKVDLNNGMYQHFPEGMVENTKHAVVRVDDIKREHGI